MSEALQTVGKEENQEERFRNTAFMMLAGENSILSKDEITFKYTSRRRHRYGEHAHPVQMVNSSSYLIIDRR
jgi:hypothetical protein